LSTLDIGGQIGADIVIRKPKAEVDPADAVPKIANG
jgi:hypothetical protein